MPAITDITPATRRPALGIVSALFGGVIVAGLGGIHFSTAAQYVPFIASLVFFGLPHGALDHLVPSRLAGTRVTPRAVALVVVVYLALGSVVVALWFITPAGAAVGFIALTWFHWGQGDLFALITFSRADYLTSRARRALACAVRGGLPMLVPLLAWPHLYRHVLAAAAGLFSPGAGTQLAFIEAPEARIAAGLLFAALTFSHFVLAWRGTSTGKRRAVWLDLAETALLTLFFVVVPPVLAVGLYFCLWHALRHIIRLGQLTTSSHPLIEFARDAAPITAVSLAFLALIFVLVPHSHGSPSALLGLYLVALSALTLPHVMIVSWMDARQKVWL